MGRQIDFISQGKRIILRFCGLGAKVATKNGVSGVIPRVALIFFALFLTTLSYLSRSLTMHLAHPAFIACPLVLLNGLLTGGWGSIFCIVNKHYCVTASGIWLCGVLFWKGDTVCGFPELMHVNFALPSLGSTHSSLVILL